MPSFMPIGPKLWALEGYIQTVLLLLYRPAYRPAPRTFQLALRDFSVASLPQNFQKKKVCINRLKMV